MLEHLDQELQNLAARSLCRRLTEVEEVLPGGRVRVNGRVLLNLSSNDYLGLSIDPRLISAAGAAAARWGVGAGASRLVTGHLSLHREVEERLAAFKGTEAAVIFSTGYMANLGVISALVGPGDTVFCDRLNHASIYDGIKLSGATLARFPHRDLDRLENLLHQAGPGLRLIVTDSVFSVDGDLAPLQGLVDLKERYDAALMVDEAHATGVLGPGGRAWPRHWDSRRGEISTWALSPRPWGRWGDTWPATGASSITCTTGPGRSFIPRPCRPRSWGPSARPWAS